MESIGLSRERVSTLTDKKRHSFDQQNQDLKVTLFSRKSTLKKNKMNSAFTVLVPKGRIKADLTHTKYPVIRECAEELAW